MHPMITQKVSECPEHSQSVVKMFMRSRVLVHVGDGFLRSPPPRVFVRFAQFPPVFVRFARVSPRFFAFFALF